MKRNVVGLLCAVLATACDRSAGSGPVHDRAVHFDTTAAVVRTGQQAIPISVELAVSQSQQAYGLMERDSLPDSHGMLFLYTEDQSEGSAFYMFRTRVALDIAFLDSDGMILAVQTMEPCVQPYPDLCRRYRAAVPFRAALEVNAGWFRRHDVQAGDRVDW